jgi:hypothetical protein
MSDFAVALFHTTSSAMRAEKVLLQAGFLVRLVPMPRALSSDCGVAVRLARDEMEPVRRLLAEARVEVAGLHPV